ncbi:hypothetical protein BMS3Bbin02_02190 [bacterium BMS3Bbin02]|nr:hypothetical protein BMS3Bbin02_02190 [bacterium BMS3Bbin02]
MTPTYDDLGSLTLLTNLKDVRLDAIVALKTLVGDALRRRHDGLGVAEIENREPVVRLLHDPGYKIALTTIVEIKNLLAFCVPKALLDDLLRRLCGNASEIIGGVFPLADDDTILIKFLTIYRHDTRVGINRDAGFLGSAGRSFVSTHQSVGERVKNGVGRDALIAGQELKCVHHIVIHVEVPSPFACPASHRVPM